MGRVSGNARSATADRDERPDDQHDQLPALRSSVCPFGASSIQPMAASGRWKPVGPFSPTHQASVATAPPAWREC